MLDGYRAGVTSRRIDGQGGSCRADPRQAIASGNDVAEQATDLRPR